ncbi:hypothetical protein EXM22_09415 [Oceanispirochaeta crateris]|uniref:TIGR04141 family sporadically distributed protein n=1 Tax=Oceanispirochaeta crateris TaxID=2518645 RepID=A0A5C1QNR2_9SPIO|nr:DUF6119 family protein [Oceanispirochaeta crateris]QEN08194.1 hypothetical protein EXM22_09415 [Oceanispirochaeta crateris]
MANTSDLKVYLIKKDENIEKLSEYLVDEKGYIEVNTKNLIQKQMNVTFLFLLSNSYNKPDWYNLIHSYIELDASIFKLDQKQDLLFYNHSFIGIIEDSDNKYLICGGGAANTLYKSIEQSFGIKILERLFDQDENKIEMVDDKGLIGDILASSRYYRRGRSIIYEDDFGKYFQKILVRLSKDQIESVLPEYAKFRSKKMGDSVAVSGSNCFNIKGKIDFITLIKTLKDISTILRSPPKPLFNTKLKPLSSRSDKSLILQLENLLISKIILMILKKREFDFDICSKDIEAFYSSSAYEICIPILSFTDKNQKNTITSDDIDKIRTGSFIDEIIIHIQKSKEYKAAQNKINFIHNLFTSIYLKTYDSSSHVTTEDKIINYIQTELNHKNISYFLLDSVWYELKTKFDDDLNEKFIRRVTKNINNLQFIKNWPIGMDENEYNELYDNKVNPIFLHKILIGYIEICDVIYIEKNVTYIIHVKDDLDSKIRDLTSQAFISSRIIEEEKRSKNKENLKKLYKSAVANKRLDSSKIDENCFIEYFTKNKIEYCLVVRPKGKTEKDIKEGKFSSRIAKFSLFELSTIMYGGEMKLHIVIR